MSFFDSLYGIAVGGDYRQPDLAETNIVLTTDGGRTWMLQDVTHMKKYLSGMDSYRSGNLQLVVGVGTNIAGYSLDGAKTWSVLEGVGYNAVSLSPNGATGWAVGSGGRVARLQGLEPPH